MELVSLVGHGTGSEVVEGSLAYRNIISSRVAGCLNVDGLSVRRESWSMMLELEGG